MPAAAYTLARRHDPLRYILTLQNFLPNALAQPVPAMLATAARHSHANAAYAIKTAGNNTVQPQSDGKIKKIDKGAAMCDACAASCEQACYKEACA